jgi:dimeric dUTPase (all-alpha-NTP-PPase superfamily)
MSSIYQLISEAKFVSIGTENYLLSHRGLEDMFELQSNLCAEYRRVNIPIPYFPMAITTKEEQKFIRELVGFATEELIEFHQEYQKLPQMANELIKLSNLGDTEAIKTQLEASFEQVCKVNEELVDVLHFIIELSLALNIGPEEIRAYYTKLLCTLSVSALISPYSILDTMIEYGKYTVYEQGLHRELGAIKLRKFFLGREQPQYLAELDLDSISAGQEVATGVGQIAIKTCIYDVIYFFNRLTQNLKAKDWRQKSIDANADSVQEALMEVWLHYMKLYTLIGGTDLSLNCCYFAKNTINLQRIQQKY